MGYEKIMIGSISYAIKAKRLLAKEGITADLIKDTDRSAGCSYGLSYPSRYAFRVSTVLSSAGISIREREGAD